MHVPVPEVVQVDDADSHIYPAEEVPMVKPAWRSQQKKKLTKRHPQQRDSVLPHAEEVAPPMPVGSPHPTSWASWKRE